MIPNENDLTKLAHQLHKIILSKVEEATNPSNNAEFLSSVSCVTNLIFSAVIFGMHEITEAPVDVLKNMAFKNVSDYINHLSLMESAKT